MAGRRGWTPEAYISYISPSSPLPTRKIFHWDWNFSFSLSLSNTLSCCISLFNQPHAPFFPSLAHSRPLYHCFSILFLFCFLFSLTNCYDPLSIPPIYTRHARDDHAHNYTIPIVQYRTSYCYCSLLFDDDYHYPIPIPEKSVQLILYCTPGMTRANLRLDRHVNASRTALALTHASTSP